ncbi:Spy/CpxP family protein refolding chaperone [Flavobacterium sp. N1994]|uniref:Spy/CpxP family protein refolding chaperone n=1 Tax=Flavobacterium sp. N1994 TaxID=2986827 RepID=UPI002223C666|nr:periplasmic heavy metal sensor [Flavobacterium sp. N1994]
MDIFSQHKVLTRTIAILVLLNLALVSFFVWKELKPRHEPLLFPKNEKYKDVSGILKQELELNNQQVKQFDAIREDYFNKEIQLKQTIKDDKDAMNQEMFNKETNESTIMMLAKRIASNEYKMELLRYSQAKELKAICSPQQQERFESLVKEIRDYFRPDNQPIKR